MATCLALPWHAASAESDAACWLASLDRLRASSPDGFAIYRQVTDPDFFRNWVRCDDAQFDLPTAVHESTHFVTSETDAFPLVGGGAVKMPHVVSSFFPPSQIANRFEPDDLTTIYLRPGKASSSSDFLYLLDELNAYSHDLNAAVDLKELTSADTSVDHRDGLAAMMAFVATYIEAAREGRTDRQTSTWEGLRHPQVAGTIATLWDQAEHVMASSCGIPNYGTRDKAYIRRLCTADAQTALTPILGRAPLCPTACLTPAPDVEMARATDAGRSSSAAPWWLTSLFRTQATPGRADIGSADMVDAGTADERR